MAISVNHNLMAANTARTLNTHYRSLATSTQRLSSGLRINGAADDAAGLAIRELMRADVAAYNQGIRNANDAISMIQVVDGALGIIDEKLIRMKELAEQAATGTYDSTQRLMIDSEFQAMASEIQRIATATDFNGIKLLNSHEEIIFPDGIELNVENKTTINTTNYKTEISYRLGDINSKPAGAVRNKLISTESQTGIETTTYYLENYKLYKQSVTDIDIETSNDLEVMNIGGFLGVKGGALFVNCTILSRIMNSETFELVNTRFNGGDFDIRDFENTKILDIKYEYVNNPEDIDSNCERMNHKYSVSLNVTGGDTIDIISDIYERRFIDMDEIKLWPLGELHDHGVITTKFPSENHHKQNISVEEIPLQKKREFITIHFGPMNDSAADYYDIEKRDCTLKGLGLEDVRIETQDNAQQALGTINDAIVKKDQARAYYGAMQNRLENTVSNLTIQSENLQASESRISDVDVATEMTNFVRNQILTQSAIAMLSQANSMPQMAMQLIGG